MVFDGILVGCVFVLIVLLLCSIIEREVFVYFLDFMVVGCCDFVYLGWYVIWLLDLIVACFVIWMVLLLVNLSVCSSLLVEGLLICLFCLVITYAITLVRV